VAATARRPGHPHFCDVEQRQPEPGRVPQPRPPLPPPFFRCQLCGIYELLDVDAARMDQCLRDRLIFRCRRERPAPAPPARAVTRQGDANAAVTSAMKADFAVRERVRGKCAGNVQRESVDVRTVPIDAGAESAQPGPPEAGRMQVLPPPDQELLFALWQSWGRPTKLARRPVAAPLVPGS
jgi:hypothetical protein